MNALVIAYGTIAIMILAKVMYDKYIRPKFIYEYFKKQEAKAK